MFTFEWKPTDDPDFITLTRELDAFFRSLLGDAQATFEPYNAAASLSLALVAYAEGKPAACGALKLHSDRCAELKRIYVRSEYRQKGLAARMIDLLEEKSRAEGYTRTLLETNPAFTSAVSLYHRLGYARTPNFGCYCGMNTLCMAKNLKEKP